MSNNITQCKIPKRGNTVRVRMLNRGPLVQSNSDTALKRLQIWEDKLTQRKTVPAKTAKIMAIQSWLYRHISLFRSRWFFPLLVTVCFLMGYDVYRFIIERALANSDRLGSTCSLLTGQFFANHWSKHSATYMVVKHITGRF